MKKLSTTWRHQKPFNSNKPGASTESEQPCQAVGRRCLGRFPIASSVVLKTVVNIVPETDTVGIAPCRMDEDSTEDTQFSDSLDADLLKAFEEEEKALAGIYEPHKEPDIISSSNSELSRETENAENFTATVEPALSSKLGSKRKYIKTSMEHTAKIGSNADCDKQQVIRFLRTTVGSNVSPTSSPMDKRPKCSVASTTRITRSGSKSNSDRSQSSKPLASSAVAGKLSGLVSTVKKSAVKGNEVCSLNDSFSGNTSLNLSDFSFSPLSLGGDADMFNSSEDETSNSKSTGNRDLMNNDKCRNNKSGAVLHQRRLFDHSCKNVKHPTIVQKDVDNTNCHNKLSVNTVTKKNEFSVISQNQSPQNQFQATENVNTQNVRSQGGDQSGRTTSPSPINKPAKQLENHTECNQRVLTAFENASNSNNNNSINKVNRFRKLHNQQKNIQLVDERQTCVPFLEESQDQVGRGVLPENMESCRKQQPTLLTSGSGSNSLTVDKRQLSSWGLPEPVLEAYRSQGVLTMFEWQAECLLTGNVLDGGNLVYSAPTSAGKTLVAELLILKRVLESRKKALFILPFVSVVREKVYSLQRLYQDAGVRVGGFMGSHSPPGGFSHIHIAVCTIEKGNSLINRLMEEGKLGELGAVVIDELHMVGDSHRGYLLELMLTKLAYITQRSKEESTHCPVQIIGMSATLPNLALLAKWLNASLYCTDFRPVPLSEYIKIDRSILNEQLVVQREIPADLISPDDADHVIALCLETVGGGHGVLVFCPTKNWCEKLCEAVARKLYTLFSNKQEINRGTKTDDTDSISILELKMNLDKSSLVDTVEQLKRSPAGLDPMLGKCVLQGVAYHHAGLTFDERDIIEGAFRQGHLKILVATSTLSSGVNLPARRVIIRSPMFYGKVIDTLTYKQMVGRAGRKGIDTKGESILICKPTEKNMGKKLMESSLPSVKSCLHFDTKEGLTGSLKRAILEVVVSGVAPTPGDVITYINCTLLSASLSEDTQRNLKTALVDSCIQFLQDNEFVTVNITYNEDGTEIRKFYPTQLGSAILASSLSPDEGLLIFAELQKARRAFVLDTELHIIYLVTPVYAANVSTSVDWYHYHHLWETLTPADRRVADLVGISESFIARAIQGRIGGKTEVLRRSLAIHLRFYTALILNSLVQECPLMEVAAKFHCNKGQLQSLQQSASTYAGMITVFCGRLGWHNLELILSQFHKRLSFGVQQELIDLVRISALNATSARMLYNAGYHTVTDVARAESADIENLFKNAVPFQSEKRQDGETDWELKERRRARCIWLTGRKGVTELDAAMAIIDEAKVIVQGDLGVSDIVWGAKNNMEEELNADEEESSVTEDYTEVSGTKELGNQNVQKTPLNHRSQCCDFKMKGNTVGTESKNTHNTGNEGREMPKQEEELSSSVGSSPSGHRQLCADLTQRKSLSNNRRNSNISFRKSFNHSRSKDRSFFGQVVVSPPVSVRVQVNTPLHSSVSERTACAKVTCEKTTTVIQKKDTADENERSREATLQRKNRHDLQLIKDGDAIPSMSFHSGSAAVAAAVINTSSVSAIPFVTEYTKKCLVETPNVSFQVMNSNKLKEGTFVDDSIFLADDSISFSDSFNIDTQTANIFSHNGQEAEHKEQTHAKLNNVSSPTGRFKISISESDARFNQTSAGSTVNKLIKNTDCVSAAVTAAPSIDSIYKTLASDYEHAGQNTPLKSDLNISSENVNKHLSETLFDSAEKLPVQNPTTFIGSTPKRSTAKSVHCLQYHLENVVVMNTAVASTSRKFSHEAKETWPWSVMQSERTTNKNIDYCSDEEDICTSLIAASNFERLTHLDEGILEENTHEELDFSSADFHIIDTEVDNVPENNPVDCSEKNGHGRILRDGSHLDSEHVVSCSEIDDAASISGRLLQLHKTVPRNSTPVAAVNVRRQNSQRVQQTDYICKDQRNKQYFGESKQINKEEQSEQGLTKTINPTGPSSGSGIDTCFSDSFSSSLMDKIMAECEFASKSQERKHCESHKNSAVNFNENYNISKHSFTYGETNIDSSLNNTPTGNRKHSIEPVSNNSSVNDGSDCVPPTPPDKSLTGLSSFKVTFFSPLKPNIPGTCDSILIPKRATPKFITNIKDKENFTIIKDPKNKTACPLNNVDNHTVHQVSEKSTADCQFSKCIQSSPSTHKRTHEKNKSSVNPSEPDSGQNNLFESVFPNHSQRSSIMLTQQSFTIIDVCANRQLFQTFLAELKSQPYYALSVACEKKPPEGPQRKASEIGGKFIRKKTSPSVCKSTVAVGIPVPDSDAFIVGLAFSWENRDSYFVSLMPAGTASLESHPDDTLAEPPLDETVSQHERVTSVLAVLGHQSAGNKQTIAVYDSKAAYVCLAKALGLSLPQCEDPCVADWLREPDAKLKNLHHMVVTYCSEELGLLDAVGGIAGYQSMGSDIKSRVNGRLRACTESVLTQKLMNRFHGLLTDENLLTAFTDVEMPSIVTLARMELNGFGISESEIDRQKALLTAKLNILEAQAYQMAGHVFSLTSTTDIATVLYQELKLPINGDTTVVARLPAHTRRSTRIPVGGTSKEILEKLQKVHPLPAVILEWRRLSSALTKSLFALKRAARHCPKLGMFRVYGDCQIFTSTGRVSMAEPNLQNVPKDFAVDVPSKVSTVNQSRHETSDLYQTRAVAPVSMRKMFVPFKGGVILAADYSQLELRIIAHLSEDSRLITILNTKDGDVFKIIAAQMKGLDIVEVSNEHRQQAKQVCYGMLYGIGPKALGEQLGMDENDADAFMETFKSRYPGIRKYLKHTVEFCQKNGYVKTLFNRRRYLPSIKDTNPHARSQAERQAVNTTIQGSAADLVKIAMTNIDRTIMDLFPDARSCHTQWLPSPDKSARQNKTTPSVTGAFLVLQLHDELIYEVSANQVQDVARLVKHHMEGAVKLSVCMPVKIKVGPSWGELQDYDVLD
ncbi:unnamed protein product [Candidula unifasciata]|uniref:DNA polymerase theta n=1 Tax=Candidula unifasciata TaxID=100452 RepID=A0A8S4A0U0_9EUPU|nr:unnamed protein product [Candidula unifasciata]